MDAALQMTDALAMNEADLQNAALPALVQIGRNQAADFPGLEGVQVQDSVDGQKDRRRIGVWRHDVGQDLRALVLARTIKAVVRRLDSGRSPRRSFCMMSMAAAPRRSLGCRTVVKGTRKCSLS